MTTRSRAGDRDRSPGASCGSTATGSESRPHADATVVPDLERRGPAADGGGDAGHEAAATTAGTRRSAGRALSDEEGDQPAVGCPVLRGGLAAARHGRGQGPAAWGSR